MKDTIRKTTLRLCISGSMFYISDIWKCKIGICS